MWISVWTILQSLKQEMGAFEHNSSCSKSLVIHLFHHSPHKRLFTGCQLPPPHVQGVFSVFFESPFYFTLLFLSLSWWRTQDHSWNVDLLCVYIECIVLSFYPDIKSVLYGWAFCHTILKHAINLWTVSSLIGNV